MRVVLCTDGIVPHAMGGMQRHSRLLAEHLAKRPGIELTVIHPHGPGVFDPALGIEEVHVAPIDVRRFYLRELWTYSARVAAELERARPDVILSQGFCVWKHIGRFTDRLVVMPHGLEMFQMLTRKERLLGWPFRAALRYIVRRSAVVLSLGGLLTDVLQRLVRGTACRVVVIPNAVDAPAVLPAPAPAGDGPLRLLFVGRFAFNKGLDVLMEVAQRIHAQGSPNVRFLLAGDGPLLQHHRERGLPGNVEVLGRVSDEQLGRLYAECDALVLPTRFEGMPTVVLEAMARAKPIFVSNVGATAELVNMHNGYLLPPGDAPALYNAVLAFAARSREVHAKMGAYGRERVLERFTWPNVVRRFEEVMGSVCEPGGDRSRPKG